MTTLADPLSLTRLLDEAVRLSRAHFRTIWTPVALPVAAAATLMSALQVSMSGFESRADPPWAVIGAWAASVLLLLVVSMFAYAALLRACTDAVAGRAVDMGAAWTTLLNGRLLLAWLLGGLGIVAGTMCCLVPGLVLGLLWSVTTPVVLEEGLGGVRALGRSADLMQHNPSGNLGDHPMLHMFLVFFTAGILSYAASLLVSLPMLLAMGVVAMRAAMSGGAAGDADAVMQTIMWIQVPTQFASQLVQMAVQVFAMMALVLLYFELRRRREGVDLDAAVGAVGLPPANP